MKAPTCKCGEPEHGEHGWFSTDADGKGYRTFCNSCGAVIPTRTLEAAQLYSPDVYTPDHHNDAQAAS